MNKFLKILVITIAALAIPLVVVAAQDLPQGRPIDLQIITEWVTTVVRFMLIMSGIVATGFIIWGGVMWMAAGANQTKVEEAKKRIVAGLWGAAIIFGVFVILATVQGVITGEFFNYDGSSSQDRGGDIGATCTRGSDCRYPLICGLPGDGRAGRCEAP